MKPHTYVGRQMLNFDSHHDFTGEERLHLLIKIQQERDFNFLFHIIMLLFTVARCPTFVLSKRH